MKIDSAPINEREQIAKNRLHSKLLSQLLPPVQSNLKKYEVLRIVQTVIKKNENIIISFHISKIVVYIVIRGVKVRINYLL